MRAIFTVPIWKPPSNFYYILYTKNIECSCGVPKMTQKLCCRMCRGNNKVKKNMPLMFGLCFKISYGRNNILILVQLYQ